MIHAAYLHIPFCEHICHYCDFNKVFLKGQPVDEYLLAMEKEIKLTFAEVPPPKKFSSIFVGGGTPTSLTVSQLDKLCEIITNNLSFDAQTEFTFEANPGDLSKEKFQILKNAGVNRLSFGVQTFNNELLKKIGRTHRAQDVLQTIQLARETGFENISIDLIYSLPDQTMEDFTETLKAAFALNLPHYSGYSLIIEPKTVFYNLFTRGKLPTVSEDIEAKMYETLMEQMEKHGYQQYEISNFSKPGYESRHNLTYWNNEPYFGFGAGAHCYVEGYRRSNFGPLKKYMEPLSENVLPIMEKHLVTKNESIEEEMFLGLRKQNGVSLSKFLSKFNEDLCQLFKEELNKLQKQGLIEINRDAVRLTKRGKLLGNEVFQSFLGGI